MLQLAIRDLARRVLWELSTLACGPRSIVDLDASATDVFWLEELEDSVALFRTARK